MDFFDFLNSNSVASYLKETGYRFSAQEAAFVVKHSRKATYAKKCAAWNEIINTMPDCSVICRFDYPQYKSLHQFLKEYMSLVNRVGEKAKEEKFQDDEYDLFTAFDFMWFATPAPFQKGDLIYNVADKERKPFLVTDLSFWHRENETRRNERDYSDMSAHGYIMRNGHYDYDWTVNYLDFEYYDRPLEGQNRALLALSSYLKDKIDLEKFLNGYLLICDEERTKTICQSMNLDDEGKRLAGLKL